jgi:hypothetical protein
MKKREIGTEIIKVEDEIKYCMEHENGLKASFDHPEGLTKTLTPRTFKTEEEVVVTHALIEKMKSNFGNHQAALEKESMRHSFMLFVILAVALYIFYSSFKATSGWVDM